MHHFVLAKLATSSILCIRNNKIIKKILATSSIMSTDKTKIIRKGLKYVTEDNAGTHGTDHRALHVPHF